MACKTSCRLCDKIRISQAITFTGGNLIINLPAGNYGNGCKYCLVLAQAIPAATTINAPVFVTIGTGTQLYPVTKCDCSQLTACGIRTRTRYATRVVTNPTGGSFRLLGDVCCAPNNQLLGINGTAPAAAPAATETPDEPTT